MAYNHGREDRKWRIWKEAEEKLLRECGVDEATIEQIRMADRAASFCVHRALIRIAALRPIVNTRLNISLRKNSHPGGIPGLLALGANDGSNVRLCQRCNKMPMTHKKIML